MKLTNAAAGFILAEKLFSIFCVKMVTLSMFNFLDRSPACCQVSSGSLIGGTRAYISHSNILHGIHIHKYEDNSLASIAVWVRCGLFGQKQIKT